MEPLAFANIRRGRPALLLTLGVWGFCLLAMAAQVWMWRDGFPAWAAPFLGVVTLSGVALSGVIFLAVERLATVPVRWRWPALILIVVIATFAQACLDHAAYREILGAFGETVPDKLTFGGVALNFLLYVWLFGLYAVGLELLAATALAAENARRAAEAHALAQEARLAALRFQLNPHFLFNTLNAISSLMLAGRAVDADRMMVKLAGFLRASLGSEQEALRPLADELETAAAYLDIESVRFGQLVATDIDCPEELFAALAPNLILQPLLENAVKYAVAPSGGKAAICIRVEADDDELQVSVIDTGAGGVRVPRGGTGIGLSNTRRRLETLFADRGRLETHADAGGFIVTVRLPLLYRKPAEAAA